MNELVIKLLLISGELRDQFGREPTSAELAERLGLEAEEVEKLLDKVQSPDGPLVPLDAATRANLRETSERVLASLTPREQRVLRMRFGVGMNTGHSLDEVGRQFVVTREHIRQIERKALRKPSRTKQPKQPNERLPIDFSEPVKPPQSLGHDNDNMSSPDKTPDQDS